MLGSNPSTWSAQGSLYRGYPHPDGGSPESGIPLLLVARGGNALNPLEMPTVQDTPSLLDNIETTVIPATHSSYQSYKRTYCEAEWASTAQLYRYLDDRDHTKRLEQLKGCRTYAWFARHQESGEVQVFSNNCRLRWCPLCAQAHRNYVTRSVSGWLEHARYPKFLTLTLKHSDAPLEHQIDCLYDAFKRLRKRALLRNAVRGGIWFFQIKKSRKTSQWHPHLHCVLSGRYIDHYALKNLWYKLTKTSNVVDIRLIRDPEETASEVARYASRPAYLSNHDLIEAIDLADALHGRRLCGTWGTANQVSLKPPKVTEKGDWISVGTWSTVTHLSESNQDAKDILEAWTLNHPLESDVSLLEFDNMIDNIPLIGELSQETWIDEDPQNQFWDT